MLNQLTESLDSKEKEAINQAMLISVAIACLQGLCANPSYITGSVETLSETAITQARSFINKLNSND